MLVKHYLSNNIQESKKISLNYLRIIFYLSLYSSNFEVRVKANTNMIKLRDREQYNLDGSLGIAPTRNCTHFLKIGFQVAVVGFYSYYIHQGNKSDQEREIVRNKLSFNYTKRSNTFFKRWVQFCVGAIPRLPNWIKHVSEYFVYLVLQLTLNMFQINYISLQ